MGSTAAGRRELRGDDGQVMYPIREERLKTGSWLNQSERALPVASAGLRGLVAPSCRAANMAYPGEDYDNDVRGLGGGRGRDRIRIRIGIGIGIGILIRVRDLSPAGRLRPVRLLGRLRPAHGWVRALGGETGPEGGPHSSP